MGNKTKLSLTILSVTATFLASGLTACGNSKWHETSAKFTGDPTATVQPTNTKPNELVRGQTVTVDPEQVVVPKTDEDVEIVTDKEVVIDRNEPLIVTDPTPQASDGTIRAVTVNDEEVRIRPEHVTTKPPVEKPEDKFFMIQNIATEKVRIYRNCASKDEAGHCQHKMVLETDMTAGEDEPTRRSILGSYAVTGWTKFYQDHELLFPSFFDPKYPTLPKEGAELKDWMSKDLLPGGKGKMRGSFGWYTAKVGPDASEQWTHGTFGWGKDGGKFITESKDVKMDLRSRGCTRIENQAIAFMREFMPERSKIYKVYAKESVQDAKLTRYQEKNKLWNWVLSKDGVRSTTSKPGVKANEGKEVLDKGTYELDQKPKAAKGNVYKIKAESFKGTFNVDTGRFVGYEHPKEIRVQGKQPYKLSSQVIEVKTEAAKK